MAMWVAEILNHVCTEFFLYIRFYISDYLIHDIDIYVLRGNCHCLCMIDVHITNNCGQNKKNIIISRVKWCF